MSVHGVIIEAERFVRYVKAEARNATAIADACSDGMYSPDYVARKRQLAVVLNNMAHFAEKIEAESRRLKEQGSTLKREGSQ